ncbi:Capsule polysaccharide biosynthesis protein [Grimontia celer]|uniref:Capsule polysaccharide biosynthesis protein n=1 Tax=Grimontia celer TaxID=1796497 RepID=A0A128F011_9GAMM|nr:hypothetical protein [Grimontia celer]CZF80152.1 Capsule polysaccharide biosynthesis protein [Grimontia celer]
MSKEIRLIALDPPYSRYFKDLVKCLDSNGNVGFKRFYISTLGYLVFGVGDASLIKAGIVRKKPSFTTRKRVVTLAKKLNYSLSAKTLYRSAQYVEWLRAELEQYKVNTCLMYNATRFHHALAITLFEQMNVSYYVFERGNQRGKTTTLLTSPTLVSLPVLIEKPGIETAELKHYGTETFTDYVLFSLFLIFDRIGSVFRLNFEPPDKILRKKNYPQILFQWVKAKYSPTPVLDRQYLLVPLQLEYDSQVRLFSTFKSTQAFIEAVEKGFYRSTLSEEYSLVFTTHPFECKKHQFDPRSHCYSGKTGVLMSDAIAVATINSTSGMEAIEKLKPCFIFGDAIYKQKGIVIPTTQESFTDSLNQWHQDAWSPSQHEVESLKRRVFVSTQVIGSVYKYDAESLDVTQQKIVS